MYASYETPEISARILYYDTSYSKQFADSVLCCVEGNGLFSPVRFQAGHLSRNRFRSYAPESRSLLLQAYSEKDVLGLAWENTDSRKSDNYLFANWTLTFYKKNKIVGTPAVTPWNVLSFNATYKWMQDKNNCANFFRCIKQLIPIIRPFAVEIDDVSNSISIRHSDVQETLLKPKHLHSPKVYWGNYWGPDICCRYDMSTLSKIHVNEIEELAGGVYFTLSDDVLKFDTPECQKIRKDIQLLVIKG